ncbi:glutamyl-tRNA reductase [Bryobacter aggregatus]|uniref:glutamyl-tRNA reductase n=1 Tax=Bryobacter aggregatus TaxID=360054 RepID=UPI0004E1AD89|nr:glutamyl-tRNA reductase [Bryobacter aggregatus]
MSRFAICGLSHRTAPVEVREKFALSAPALPAALTDLNHQQGVQESLILSTCNRVELALSLDESADLNGALHHFLEKQSSMSLETVDPYLYKLEGRDAVRHLFRVAASLDSMVVGEPQILGQLKDAYSLAKELGTVNSNLEQVVTRAFHVAKRVRSETEIGESAVSVSYAAVELAREIFGNLAGSKVMLIGAGKMSELAARHLRNTGAKQIYVTNRTYDRAVELARLFDGWIIDFAAFKQTLPTVDIVITSTGSRDAILTHEDMQIVMKARRNKPMFIVDIAVPRNVEPNVNEIDNVFLYDIDDLQKVVDRNVKGREVAAEHAARIIEEEISWLESRMREREVSPAIVALQGRLEEVRAAEFERYRSKLGPMSGAQEEAIEAITRGIINKVAHGAITELRRQGAQGDPTALIETLRRVFRLETHE